MYDYYAVDEVKRRHLHTLTTFMFIICPSSEGMVSFNLLSTVVELIQTMPGSKINIKFTKTTEEKKENN